MCVNARVCRGLGAGDGEVLEEHGNGLGAAAAMAVAAAFLAARAVILDTLACAPLAS